MPRPGTDGDRSIARFASGAYDGRLILWSWPRTAAKLANRVAKTRPESAGVCDLNDAALLKHVLPKMSVAEVWGIGAKGAAKLMAAGIHSIADLLGASQKLVRGLLTVTGEKTVMELRGVSCVPLELAPPPRQATAVTRSFGRMLTEREEVETAIAAFVTRAGEKLREQGQVAGCLQVFVHTNPHNGDPYYSNQATLRLMPPTADTLELIATAKAGLDRIWKAGPRYFKAGVITTDLMAAGAAPQMLSFMPAADPRRMALMRAIDAVNRDWGSGTVTPGGVLARKGWKMRQQLRSPRWTTSLNELPTING